MYEIPKEFDSQALIGKPIVQICYTINSVCLYWDGGYIQIMGAFSILYDNKTYSYQEIYPLDQDYNLLLLLDKKIMNIDISDTRDSLMILFENGMSLTLYSDANYESFEVNFNSKRNIF